VGEQVRSPPCLQCWLALWAMQGVTTAAAIVAVAEPTCERVGKAAAAASPSPWPERCAKKELAAAGQTASAGSVLHPIVKETAAVESEVALRGTRVPRLSPCCQLETEAWPRPATAAAAVCRYC